jgi:hypothetical protein
MQLSKITHLDGDRPFNFFCPVTGQQVFGEDFQDPTIKSIAGYWDSSANFEAAQLSPEVETAWKAFVKEKAVDEARAAEKYLGARSLHDKTCDSYRD